MPRARHSIVPGRCWRAARAGVRVQGRGGIGPRATRSHCPRPKSLGERVRRKRRVGCEPARRCVAACHVRPATRRADGEVAVDVRLVAVRLDSAAHAVDHRALAGATDNVRHLVPETALRRRELAQVENGRPRRLAEDEHEGAAWRPRARGSRRVGAPRGRARAGRRRARLEALRRRGDGLREREQVVGRAEEVAVLARSTHDLESDVLGRLLVDELEEQLAHGQVEGDRLGVAVQVDALCHGVVVRVEVLGRLGVVDHAAVLDMNLSSSSAVRAATSTLRVADVVVT
mmetsp:Transcript_29346/g.68723  ORF Transcript_29346/g.68723 Transcript_29346/m.68723 type:complete len:288 (+) Transcript_29346:454-1317(+)